MNRLGSKDGLEWEKVKSIIRYIFRNTNIEIMIYTRLEYSKEQNLVIFKQYHECP